jgi:UPF0288 family protein (methanogenesis marker protein 3)
MAKLKVDGIEVEVPDHYTLLQAAEAAGAEGRPAKAGGILRHGRARCASWP